MDMDKSTCINNCASIPEDEHWWFHSRTMAIYSTLPPSSIGSVLDIGCGAGNMAHHLCHYGSVIGIDAAWKPLTIAWQRHIAAIPAAAPALPFAQDVFSLVAMLDLIEHCEDDAQVLREACRVCAPGGLVLITTPAFPWLWSHNDVANHHFRRYTKASLQKQLVAAGFRPLRISYTFFLVFPAAAGMLLLRRLLGAKTNIATPDTEEAYQVEMEPTPPLLNKILRVVGNCEAALLRHFNLPFGTALLAIARKE